MCDVILLTSEANVQYETGFHTTARRPKQIGPNAVILAGGEKYFLIPAKWKLQVEETIDAGAATLITYQNTEVAYHDRLAELLCSYAHKSIGIEFGQIGLRTYLYLKNMFSDVEFVDITRMMEKKRLIKKPEEIKALRHAADIAVQAMEHAKEVIRPGITEQQCAAEIRSFMLLQGSEGTPFTMKMLSGKNTEIITRVPGDKVIEAGDFTLLDFGAKIDGYSSDWTRTFSVYSESKEMRSLYETVLQIELELILQIKPGASMAALVERAEILADKSPYGKYYNPHLGHSVGITSHEWPILEPGVEGELKENMVITIEPGIYVPGIGGVRIEDEILVTRDGHEIITGLMDENHIIAER